jgi:hypothetical protein
VSGFSNVFLIECEFMHRIWFWYNKTTAQVHNQFNLFYFFVFAKAHSHMCARICNRQKEKKIKNKNNKVHVNVHRGEKLTSKCGKGLTILFNISDMCDR